MFLGAGGFYFYTISDNSFAITTNMIKDKFGWDLYDVEEQEENKGNFARTVRLANWNLQIFGTKKADNEELMNFYAETISDYDIIFIQEIRNKDQTAFARLCDLLSGYNCEVSSRAGRSTSKEQYGIIFREGIILTDLVDFNPDEGDRWERPPIKVEFNIGGYDLTVWNIHIKPDDVEVEIDYLEEVVSEDIVEDGAKGFGSNVIVIGDLNLDCSYDDGEAGDFEGWTYLIGDEEDTTVGSTDCAYDRIILNGGALDSLEDFGIFTGVNEEQSDHYLVWVELEI